MQNTLRTLAFAAGASALWTSPAAYGRFLLEDEGRIDTEERLGSESYNDRLSYRYPLPWEWQWQEHQVGARANAGSFTVSRFDYLEEFKAAAHGEGGVHLVFAQHRAEDMVESRQERLLGLGFDLGSDWQLYALGDVGSYKEYGDLGLSLSWGRDAERRLTASYWSVDHYYASKKTDPADTRDRTPQTLSGAADWRFTKDWRLSLRYEWDQAFAWHRPSRGYAYHHAARRGSMRTAYRLSDIRLLELMASFEQKSEAKDFFEPSGAPSHGKSMQRLVREGEIRASQVQAGYVAAMGLWGVARDARYLFDNPLQIAEEAFRERPGPPSSRRREAAAYATLLQPVLSRHSVQWGLYLNQVRIDEARAIRTTECKTQIAWDYSLSKTARGLINTTWDMDQLGADFPYDKRPFRPWGGGNLQIMAVF